LDATKIFSKRSVFLTCSSTLFSLYFNFGSKRSAKASLKANLILASLYIWKIDYPSNQKTYKKEDSVVSQNYFTTQHPTPVRKLTNRKIRWIIRQLDEGTPVKEIAAVMRVTPRRIYQIKKQYGKNRKDTRTKTSRKKTKANIQRNGANHLASLSKVQAKSSNAGKTDRKRSQHPHSTRHNL